MQTSSLSALLLCNDAHSLRVLYEQLQRRSITQQICDNAQGAVEAMALRRYDLLFVDLDIAGPDWFVSFYEAKTCLQNTAVIVIASNKTLLDLEKKIARFALHKPLLAAQTGQTVEAACNSILQSKLPAFRYSTNMSVLTLLLNNGKEKKLPNTTLKNISVTGAGLNSPVPMPVGETVSLHFYVPDVHVPNNGHPFHAVGKVIWSDGLGHCGIRFQQVSTQHFRSLRSWLAVKAAEYVSLSRQSIPLAGSIS